MTPEERHVLDAALEWQADHVIPAVASDRKLLAAVFELLRTRLHDGETKMINPERLRAELEKAVRSSRPPKA